MVEDGQGPCIGVEGWLISNVGALDARCYLTVSSEETVHESLKKTVTIRRSAIFMVCCVPELKR